MHSRNPYKEPPDFIALSKAYPKLSPFLIPSRPGQSTIDFWNNDAQRALTEALLHRDFGIKLTLPKDRLCPPVPNRLNYILWLQDIVRQSRKPPDSMIKGLDVGTGASAIYPLLGCALEPHWEFIATDIDETSFQHASLNVSQNSLQGRIKVVKTIPEDALFGPLSSGQDSIFDFTMCNPPFYADAEEVLQSTELKHLPPNSVCTGVAVEMITLGGETRFVQRMVEESWQNPLCCRWYTSMLGKMGSLIDIVKMLRGHNLDNYAITEFVQGQTRRWAVGWSHYDNRLPDSIARIENPNPTIQGLMPGRNTIIQPFKQRLDRSSQDQLLIEIVSAIKDITVKPEDEVPRHLVIEATGDTWSRKARRAAKSSQSIGTKAKFEEVEMVNNSQGIDHMSHGEKSVMACAVGWKEDRDNETGGCCLVFQWLRGKDRALFSSFCSYVTRKLQSTM